MTPSDESLPRVAPVDLRNLSPEEFTDDELDLPYALTHVHRVANAVRESGAARGFIDLPVWRRNRDNEPYNARIMESILTLAFFYTADRPWNPYRGDDALRGRLEAALVFWVDSQHDDGSFSEYGEDQWGLAPTAFATKFVGEALLRLTAEDAPAFDADLLERVRTSVRDAIVAVLTDDDLRDHGWRYSNQFANVWPGGAVYLEAFDDPALAERFATALGTTRSQLQSPAGFFYERHGPDWNYNLGTHHNNLRMAYHYLRDTDLESYIVEKERRWTEWMAYGAVREPDADVFVVNRGVDTRKIRRTLRHKASPMAEDVELARAFSPTAAEREESIEGDRDRLERTWPRTDDLDLSSFGSLSPYTFLNRDQVRWYPTAAQRAAAREQLPYHADDRFIHQRVDDRTRLVVTYVRRPTYYAAVNAAPSAHGHQRFGLGLVWHPDAGAVFQTGAGWRGAAYGTRPADDEPPYEAGGLDVTYTLDGETRTPTPGATNLPGGGWATFRTTYPLGAVGEKSITCDKDGISVAVEHDGPFVETVPLLATPGDLAVTTDGVTIGDGLTQLELENEEALAVVETDVEVADKTLTVARIHASDRLRYQIEFERA